jgi:hypothetical protein
MSGVTMSYIIETPKRTTQSSRLSNLMDLMRATPFEFEVDQPLNNCATCLKNEERVTLVHKLLMRTVKIEITPEDESTYRFYVYTQRARSLPLVATGLMKCASEQSTQVTGMVRTGRLLTMFAVFALFGLAWLFLAVQITPLLLLLPFLFSLVVLANLFFGTLERACFVDFLKSAVDHSAQEQRRYSLRQSKLS